MRQRQSLSSRAYIVAELTDMQLMQLRLARLSPACVAGAGNVDAVRVADVGLSTLGRRICCTITFKTGVSHF